MTTSAAPTTDRDTNGVTPGSWIDQAAQWLRERHGPNPFGGADICPLCRLPRSSGHHQTRAFCQHRPHDRGTTGKRIFR